MRPDSCRIYIWSAHFLTLDFFFRNKGMLLMLRWILVFTTVNTCSLYACMNFIFMESRLPLLNWSGYCCFVRLDIVCVYIIKAYCLLYSGKTLEITQNIQDIHKASLIPRCTSGFLHSRAMKVLVLIHEYDKINPLY